MSCKQTRAILTLHHQMEFILESVQEQTWVTQTKAPPVPTFQTICGEMLHGSKVVHCFYLTKCGGFSLTMFVVVFGACRVSNRLLGMSVFGGPAPWQP